MKDKIKSTLEGLVTSNNSLGRTIITGFNYFPACLNVEDYTILTLNNIHSNPDYLANVENFVNNNKNSGKIKGQISLNTRDKEGFFKWKPGFYFREEGIIPVGLRIKDIKRAEYIKLEELGGNRLEDCGFSKEAIDNLIAEDTGYEINISFSDKKDLVKLAPDFLIKASGDLPDEGAAIPNEECWPGAYNIPAIVIGGDITSLKLPGFRFAHLFRFQEGNIGEFYFVINKKLKNLKKSDRYKELINAGFKKEDCLANNMFIETYIDNI